MGSAAICTVEADARAQRALVDGFLGVLIFSASLPATRLALTGFEAGFVTVARAVIAGLLAALLLVATRQRWPDRADLRALGLVAACVVVGFPLLTALALRTVSSAHAIVFLGLLPLTTAAFGALRAGERPSSGFWLASILGSGVTIAYAARGIDGVSLVEDGMMLAAVLVCGFGYAEGGRLSRRLGGWQVIAWATVLSLPLMVPLAFVLAPQDPLSAPPPALIGLAYVGAFSMLIGLIFWYRGLAAGGIASIGQLQLLQPFLGFGCAALLLGERIEPSMLAAAAAVLACVVCARRFA